MQNLEIKCQYPDLRRAERLSREDLGATPFGTLVQTDTYFVVRRGRLKLRQNRLQADSGKGGVPTAFELICYRRPSTRSARTSDYDILPLADGASALRVLSAALGVRACVHKVRKVYLHENVRIHLDRVRGLGKFLEFELIVSPTRPLAACRRRMRELLALFRIEPTELIRGSYADLLLAARP